VSVQREQTSPTSTTLTVTADPAYLTQLKAEILKRLGKNAKVSGFRPGKSPASLIEKQIDPGQLQTEFLNDAVTQLYSEAANSENLRPIAPPKITIKKFVPFSTLEFTAEAETIGKVTLPDYKKIRIPLPTAHVSDKDVDDVIQNLRARLADRKPVTRAAQNGDEVVINFSGTDTKTKEVVKGADGTDFPLILGSDTFIPGFEANLIGLKPQAQKSFNLTFPKNYGVAALQNRQVTFDVTVTKVQSMVEPKVDNSFAAKVGPFKTVGELKADIRKQLQVEKQTEADRSFENELLGKLADEATIDIPVGLIDEEVEHTEQDIRQNLTYRGQTWEEYLAELGQSEAEYRASLRAPAERRVKAGLVLTEVAEREQLTVTPEEFEIRLQLLKGQYQDPAMLAELDKPENKRSVLSRLLSEKTIARLREYATAKPTT
jgi:trigger factor